MANAKDVVVTGVSTGIGLGTTKVLIANGYRVFGSVRKQADADRLEKEFGDRYVPLLMDITDADAIQRASGKSRCHNRPKQAGRPGQQRRDCSEWTAFASEAERVQTPA